MILNCSLQISSLKKSFSFSNCPASTTRNSGNFISSGRGKKRLFVEASSFLISEQGVSAFHFVQLQRLETREISSPLAEAKNASLSELPIFSFLGEPLALFYLWTTFFDSFFNPQHLSTTFTHHLVLWISIFHKV